MNNKILIGLVVLALALGGFAALKPEKADNVLGGLSGPTIHEALVLYGGSTKTRVNATSSTLATYTLTADDIAPNAAFYDTVYFTKIGAIATSTWTLPATSTISALPNAGSRAELCFFAATTTQSNSGIILVAGTGWKLASASTSDSLIIQAGVLSCLDVMRGGVNNVTGVGTPNDFVGSLITPNQQAQ